MLQIIFDMIAALLEGAWRAHKKRFEKKFKPKFEPKFEAKFEDRLREPSRS